MDKNHMKELKLVFSILNYIILYYNFCHQHGRVFIITDDADDKKSQVKSSCERCPLPV